MAIKHPLVNSKSKHYTHPEGVESIEYLEKMFTKEEMMVWTKITAMKYRMRIGKKDSIEEEMEKINGYENYYSYLKKKKE